MYDKSIKSPAAFNVAKDISLWNSLFGTVKLTGNADPDKYKHSGCGIEIDTRGSFLLLDVSGFGKNAILVGADIYQLVHID